MSKLIKSTLLTLIAVLLLSHPLYANDLYEYPTKQKQSLAFATDDVIVLNIWATWCAPCKKEMPMLSKWYKKQQNTKLIGIAIDSSDNIKTYLKHYPVSYPIWYFDGDTTEWLQTIDNQIGAVPYTRISIAQCQHHESIYGELSEDMLNTAIKKTKNKCQKSTQNQLISNIYIFFKNLFNRS